MSHHEPQSYCEASSNPIWQQAMAEELQALTQAYTWDMVDLPSDKTIVGIFALKNFLSHQFDMKDLGCLNYFLSLEILSYLDGYYLSQAKYSTDILALVGLTDCTTVPTLLETNVNLIFLYGTLHIDATLYRYQFISAPRSTNYTDVLRIIRYIKGTMFHSLYFSSHSSLDLRACSDADWADMGVSHSTDTVLYCDYHSAIYIAHNDVLHECTKNIEIDCHIECHHVAQGTVRLHSVTSVDQTTNIFTKSYPSGKFQELVSKLKLVFVLPP
ncbi:uncharacterized mitochondrial protein AtMg00810-like [Cornus florida]|uniref:uncharacterized mitochondrial protein AtMg00810-like n=1 Tax=Cornus florida TaxID=4283 RepID=UPI00289AE435|nr:uncharacterized mitochondrial protein AtMg00810-like [Cornus florida]